MSFFHFSGFGTAVLSEDKHALLLVFLLVNKVALVQSSIVAGFVFLTQLTKIGTA